MCIVREGTCTRPFFLDMKCQTGVTSIHLPQVYSSWSSEAREKPRSGQQRKHKHDTPVGRQAGHLLPPDQSESGSAGSHGNQPHREGSLSQGKSKRISCDDNFHFCTQLNELVIPTGNDLRYLARETDKILNYKSSF